MKRRWKALLGAGLLLSVSLFLVAAQGDENDPLITWSYLNDFLRPEVEAKVTEAVDTRAAEAEDKLAAALEDYLARTEQKLENSDGGASFVTVTLEAGQTLSGKAGCEVVPRGGSAMAAATLTDTTTGETAAAGDKLSENHLYLARVAGGILTADGAVSVMVRGEYTVE